MYKVQWLTLTEIDTALTHMDTVFYLHTLGVLLYKDQWLILTEINTALTHMDTVFIYIPWGFCCIKINGQPLLD